VNEIIRICGVALIGIVAVSTLRGMKNELSIFAGVATGIVLLGFSIGALYPILEYVQMITQGSGFALYTETILKALGISVIAESAADICRDFGESAIGARVELAAKSLIMLLALPVVESLLSLAFGVLE
jgi:stage III sporulation protein AD